MFEPLHLRGSLTALVTPFRNGGVDENALGHLTERQISHGTTGLVACGSTGEAAALSAAEHARVIAVVAEATAGRVPVIAGVGAANTEQACGLASAAAASGAQALLCSAPAYVKPTQAGIRAHVAAVFRSAKLPVVLYDIPARCAVAITDETIMRLAETGTIIALKDASGDLTRPLRLKAALGASIAQLSGDDATVPGYRAMGGDGCISVTANVVPWQCAQLHAAWDAADLATFNNLAATLAPLHQALFAETNPIPVKAALEWLGLIDGELRLPLMQAQQSTLRELVRYLSGMKAFPGEHRFGLGATIRLEPGERIEASNLVSFVKAIA